MDLVGQNIGKLTVIRKLADIYVGERKVPIWEVKCDCGAIKSIRQPSLRGVKAIQSCGCLLSEHYRKLKELTKHRNSITSGEASFNSLYSSYKIRSISKNREFSLSKELFKSLTSQNCYYCGISPYKDYMPKRSNGGYIFNGLDRLDSTIGYTSTNIVPCCEICNKAKRNLTIEEFQVWIQRIIRFQSVK